MEDDRLERMVEQGARRADRELRKRFFVTSAEVLCGGTSRSLDQYLGGVREGVGRGYAFEEHFEEILGGGYDAAARNAIIIHEAAKGVIEGLKGMATVTLNGQKEDVDLEGDAVMGRVLDGFVERYNDLNYRGIIKNEQRIINYTLEHFYGLQRGVADRIPDHPPSQETYEEAPTPNVAVPRTPHGITYHTLDDLVGLKAIKQTIRRNGINPFVKRELLGKLTRGDYKGYSNFIFEGPPGSGKSYCAVAVGGEIQRLLGERKDVGVIVTNGSDYVQEFHGRGKNMLEQRYEEASQHDVAVVVIDEADPFCSAKGSRGNELNTPALSSYYGLLDGPKTKRNVITILTTNNIEKLDSVLLTRFPPENRIHFDLPDEETKRDIVAYHLDRYQHEDFSEHDYATFLDRMGDKHIRGISQMASASMLYALEKDHDRVTRQDVLDAIAAANEVGR